MNDRLPAFLALSCVGAFAVPAYASDAAAGLDEAAAAPIVVTAALPPPPEAASAKAVAPILDTPQTVTVISDQTLRKQNLLNLYEKGKTLAWNANDLDWSIDVDLERLVRQRVANGLAPMVKRTPISA